MDTIDLGRIEYAAAWDRQRELVDRRAADEIPDTLLLCEHPHVVTIGRGLRGEAALVAAALPGPDGAPVPIFRIERGGQATYHGPGQLVAYMIVRLDRARLGLDGFLRGLEEAVIRTAADFGVSACRSPGATGVWVESGDPAAVGNRESETGSKPASRPLLKLASIGVAVRRWVTYHGLALNVNPDLRYFQLIRPCGFDPRIMTTLAAQRGEPIDFGRVKGRLTSHLASMLAMRTA